MRSKISLANKVQISGDLFTLSLTTLILKSQYKEAARYVKIVWFRYFIQIVLYILSRY